MSELDPYIFVASDVQNYVRVPVDVLRDWRRRGVLPPADMPGLWKRTKHGQWRYSVDGLLFVYALADIHSHGFDLGSSSIFAAALIDPFNEYFEHATGEGAGGPSGFSRYLAIYAADPDEKPIYAAGLTLRKWAHKVISGLEDLAEVRPVVVHLVDVAALAHAWVNSVELSEKHKKQIVASMGGEEG